MVRYLRLLFGAAAAIGFVASLLVHIAALLGVDVAAHFSGVWLLHIGIFAVFIPFVLFSRQNLGSQSSLLQIATTFPRVVTILGATIFAYAIVNFMLFMAATEAGNPTIQDGKYLLLNHGKLIREISLGEYSAFKANEVRGFSGHWLLFYYVPAAYFLGWKSNNSFKPTPLRGAA